jgi:hypothetical protein
MVILLGKVQMGVLLQSPMEVLVVKVQMADEITGQAN